MIHDVIWYETKKVMDSYCLDCFIQNKPSFKSDFWAAKHYMEVYKKQEIPPVFRCLDCCRFVYYLPPNEDHGWWTEKDITDNFNGLEDGHNDFTPV